MKLPVALQLYTVRDEMEKDFLGTLKAVREIGYEYVELAGLHGHTPEEAKAMLEEAGLKAMSAHVALAELETDSVLDGYKTIGCDYIVIPYLAEGSRPGDEGFFPFMDQLRTIGQWCRDRGMTLLYHNHDFEYFVMPDGSFGLDYMYSNIAPELLQTELDLCWVKVAEQDPVEYLKKYADRAPVVHFKDYVGEKSEGMYNLIGQKDTAKITSTFAFRPVGDGCQDFPSIVKAVYETNAKYVVVEQDQTYDMPQLEAAKRSFDYLKTI